MERRMGKKRKVSVSIDSELLDRANQNGIDLNDALEHALRRYDCEDPVVQEARWAKWREENRAAIEQSNRYFDKHGLWFQNLTMLQKPKRAGKRAVSKTHDR
jgi:antitoxin CcdA